MRRYTASIVAVFLISILVAVPVLAQAPPAPVALPPTDIQSLQFTANWDTTGYAGLSGPPSGPYRIDCSSDPAFLNSADWVKHDEQATGPYNVVTGVFPLNTYYYRIRAVNASGTSGNSNVITVPILFPPNATGATNITATGFTAHWDAIPGVSDYHIDVAKLASFGPVVHTAVWAQDVGNVSSFTVSGLTPDTTYFYRVRTMLGPDSSASSNYIAVSRIKSANTLASGTINVPYSVAVQFDGTATPVSWAVTIGSLPAGLSISTDPNTGNGIISGMPTALGTANFTVQVTDNTPATVTKAMSITIVGTPTIAFDAAVGNRYTYNNGFNSGDSITWNHTVGLGTNRMLIVQVGATSKVASHVVATRVTYNNKPLSLVKQQSETESSDGDYISVGQWYMLDKDLPTDSVPHAVVATFADSTTGEAGGSISLKYVKQARPDTVVSDSGVVNHLTGFLTTLANHSWLINTAVNGYSGGFFVGHNQEIRYQIDNGNFDIMGDTKEVAAASPDSMQANHHIFFRMAQVVLAVAPIPSATANASVKVYLQGPYNTGTDAMNNSLRTGGQLAAHFGSIPIPVGAVDSVNIEVRDSLAAAKAKTRAFAPAWLLTDGSIRDFVDTTKTYVGFGGVPAGKYYVVVRHRNHLAIMSSVRDTLDGSLTPVVYDFSTGQGQAYGTNAMIAAGTRFAMYAGDVSGDGIVKYNGAGNDRALVYLAIGGGNIALTVNGYLNADVNLDGTVMYNGAGNDRAIIYLNIGGGNIATTVQTQVP